MLLHIAFVSFHYAALSHFKIISRFVFPFCLWWTLALYAYLFNDKRSSGDIFVLIFWCPARPRTARAQGRTSSRVPSAPCSLRPLVDLESYLTVALVCISQIARDIEHVFGPSTFFQTVIHRS